MIKRIIIFVIAGGICFLPDKGIGQDIKADIESLRDAFQNLSSLSSEIHYAFYDSYEADIPVETENGVFRQKGEYSYSKMNELETIINDEMAMLINHDRREIMVQPPIESGFLTDFLINLDTAFQFFEKTEWLEDKENTRTYMLHLKNSSYQKILVKFDLETYMINKVILYLKESDDHFNNGNPIKGKLEIAYKNMKINPALSLKDFSTQAFLSKSKGQLSLTSSYSHYHIVNFLKK